MPSPYRRAFTRCIRRRWYELPSHLRNTVKSDGRKGDLGPADGDALALYDTFNYQRSHADAFCRAIKQVDLGTPPEDKAIAVIDIGAGAGTVAVALSESWKGHLARVSYMGIEPHQKMKSLGRELLHEMNRPFAAIRIKKSFSNIRRRLDDLQPSWILLTLSYVVHQSTVTESDIDAWVDAIDLIRDTHGAQNVEILATTVNSNDPALAARDSMPHLKSRLGELQPEMKRFQHWLSSDHRFPNDGRNETGWYTRSVDYKNVLCVHWSSSIGESP